MVKAAEGQVTETDVQSNVQSNGQSEGMSLDEIAKLVGYVPSEAKNGNQSDDVEAAEEDLTLDEFDDDGGVELDISVTPTKRKIHQNPIAKFLFIASLTGLFFGSVGFFLGYDLNLM